MFLVVSRLVMLRVYVSPSGELGKLHVRTILIPFYLLLD